MTNLVYLSPLPWTSFAQRPHKFVEWFRRQCGGEVLWVDPYPTRLPGFGDIRRILSKNPGTVAQSDTDADAGVSVIRPRALPIEPLPMSGLFNRPLWSSVLDRVQAFCERDSTWLAIGKPSQLASVVLRNGGFTHSIYDCMDHFASFYNGVSRMVMEKRELELAGEVDCVFASATTLHDRWQQISGQLALVHNACDPDVLPPIVSRPPRDIPVFGYVGTLGSWFDWEAVIAIANDNPGAVVRLIGPAFCPPPQNLPRNIELLPPQPHAQAMEAMADFDVGLIPFQRNSLTESVDPIKYYEYRAMGLPVISTRFGEMRYRTTDPGVFLADTADELKAASRAVRVFRESPDVAQQFRAQESWSQRFNDSPLRAALAAELSAK
jgi:glycosyltransferase involved in cell wall biosynthesis